LPPWVVQIPHEAGLKTIIRPEGLNKIIIINYKNVFVSQGKLCAKNW
jgi:hypothetical protein